MINDSNTRAAQQNRAQLFAAAVASGQLHEARTTSVLHFPDVTEDHVSPKMAEAVGERVSVPLIVSNLEEMQLPLSTQEIQMEANQQTKSPVEQLAETILNATSVNAAITAIETSGVFNEEAILSTVEVASALMNDITFEATGDYELDQVLEQEAVFVAAREEMKVKKAAEEAAELAKNPPKEPKEPKVKSELRLKAEELIEVIGITTERNYVRARQFIGYPVKAKTPPENHLTNIQKHFAAADVSLQNAENAVRKLFGYRQLA